MSVCVEPRAEVIPGYTLLERLGGGGFGEVWKAEAPGGLLKAIKIVHGDVRRLDDDGSHRAAQELSALQRVQSLRHPYLLSIERYDIIDGRLMIVTELADCNLYDRFDHFRKLEQPGIPRDELLGYLGEAAEVLDLMNQQYQLQHLDIKPQNLFLIHDHVKVADFGLVKDLQGMRTEVEGGVTPVYAAPETFEGSITPFCDQYSLAIVYQELLTGHRPFPGTSMQQLVMQHLKSSPNLSPLPHTDRPAMAKALAKKPTNRHLSCMAFVAALREAGLAPVVRVPAPRQQVEPSAERRPVAAPTQVAGARVSDTPKGARKALPNVISSIRRLEHKDTKPHRPETPPTMIRVRREDFLQPVIEQPIARTAPPEFKGNGVLTPAIIIGLGQGGMLTLRRLRQFFSERFGGMSALPHLKLLYFDTDPESVEQATRYSGGQGLEPDEVMLARLTRASHYLKPRRNGRSLIEGWFDAQWLYRIPRNPIVQGQRALGRLAFGDYYANFADRIETHLEEITSTDALLRADRNTSLGVRTNRPRIYVVASLAGGTGSGAFLDVAYAARNRLRFLGYDPASVIGIMFLPTANRTLSGNSQANANCFAALTEWAYYCHPDTRFECTFDDREAAIIDSGEPFARSFALPWDAETKNGTSRDGPSQAAELLVRDLTMQFGRAVDQRRKDILAAARPTTDPSTGTYSFSVLSWPKRALLRCSSRRLCHRVIERWANRDGTHVRETVQARVHQQCAQLKLTSENLLSRLFQGAVDVLGRSPDEYFAELCEPLVAKGWFGGLFNREAAYNFLSRCDELLGRPEGRGTLAHLGLIGESAESAAESVVKEWGAQLTQFVVALIEQPDFRLAGAEEAVSYLRTELDAAVVRHNAIGTELADKALKAHLRLQTVLGESNPRRGVADFPELARHYPIWRLHGVLHRQVADACQTMSNDLSDQLGEINFCRQRFSELLQSFATDAEAPEASTRYLLPKNCATPDDAVCKLLEGITDEDLAEIDRRMQRMVQSQFTALVHVCLSTSNVMGNLEPAMLKLAQQFLSSRLGKAGSAELFFERYPDDRLAVVAADQTYEEAAPPLGDSIGVMVGEVSALSVPPGECGERFAKLSQACGQHDGMIVTEGFDDIAFYRELPRIPLAKLPHLGPQARECYLQIADRDRFPPHTRTDVENWENPGG